MSGIQRILCPTDFSEFSRRALQHAVVLAEQFRADLVSLYVLSGAEPLVDGEPPWRTVAERDARLRESFVERLRHFVEPAKLAGVPARIALREGRAVDGILSEAEELPADLIVLGTHGASGFERLALGSVTEKVLRKVCIPVLAVPREPEGASAENVLRRPLCPVDFSPSSLRAFDFALSLPCPAETTITVLHVLRELPEIDVPELRHFSVPEYRRALEHDARKRLLHLVQERAPGRRVETVVESGKPHRRIVEVARERKASLIVMGFGGGATAPHVLRHSAAPVLTVPEPEHLR